MMPRGLLVLGSMGRTSFSYSRSALWILLVISSTAYAQREWFGSNNQYKCHCTGNNCDNNGDCTGGSGCVPGWFGPQCQYVDLLYTENDGTTKEIFRDDDDTTCNDHSAQQQATMVFEEPYPFTWLRIHVREAGSLPSITVDFQDGSGKIYQCVNNRNATVDSRTIDIHCDLDVEIMKVFVRGTGVKDLCSVYISGGRNLALRQTTSQSSNLGGFTADKAVDGNTNQQLNSLSCSHTSPIDSSPIWEVSLSRNSQVNRYVLYNRGDCCEDRLLEFTLTSRKDNQAQVFSYHDSGPPALLIYTVTTATHTSPVKSVDITTSHVDDATSTFPILTLCEVEIYGDTICPAGEYGKECELECHCSSNDACLVSTGRCVNGCAAGYTGDHCDRACLPGFYGAGCMTQCSQNCDGGCQTDNGHCYECKAGWEGTFCNSECDAIHYGKGCKNQCSTNCKDQKCDRVDGKCGSCIAGKMGYYCGTSCPIGYYGEGCMQQCNQNCDQGRCQADNGHCIECKAGWEGTFCTTQCDATHYGKGCKMSCSTNCKDQKCNRVDGKCGSCVAGTTGDFCDTACTPTTYGPRCIHQCSANCIDIRCDRSTGFCNQCPDGKFGNHCDRADCSHGKYGATCDQVCNQNCRNTDCDSNTGQCKAGCVPGYYGNMCQTQCEPGKYGKDCSSDCSEFCNTNGTRENESPCHPVSGTCSYGCVLGYEGPTCVARAESSSPDSEPGVGVGVGIGVGVTVIVVVALVGIYFYRRRKSAKKSRRERPPGYDPAEPTTEEHNYSELFKSDDGYNLPTDVASSAVTFKTPSKNSTPDTVQYVNADVNEDVNADAVKDDLKNDVTPYEDIDQITSEIDEGRKSNPREDNTGYANTGYANTGYANC